MRARLVLAVVACGCAAPPAGLVPLHAEPTYALVYSDYSSTSIGLYDGALSPIASDWVTSGTRTPILVTPVTADAVLPSSPHGRLVWIDRFPADVVTFVDPLRPGELVQLDAHGDGPATGFLANPHDAIPLPDGRVLVSRHNPDVAGSPRGNDLLAIDPATGASSRVALGCDDGRFFARPDLMVEVSPEGRPIVVVALARLDDSFTEGGEGALATVDATDLSVLGCHALPGVANCQYVRAEPGTSDRVIVLCTGQPRQPEVVRHEEAGILAVRVDATGGVSIEARIDAGTLPVEHTPAAYPIALGGGLVLATADGRGPDALSAGPDRLLLFDLVAGTVEAVAETEPFHFGFGLLEPGGATALVPDGATNELVRYDVGSRAVTDRIAVPTATGLPLRQVGALR